jgi:hypothetical protein
MPMLGKLSRILNRVLGGEPGQTLCARVAKRWGTRCLFCRLIGIFTEPDHCHKELNGYDD